MGKITKKPKSVLKLPDLDYSKSAVLNSLPSLNSRRSYEHAIRDFIDWYCSESCARLCHQAGGELEQIEFLLGHVSIQTTERYLGCKQRLSNAINDQIGLEPDSP